MSKKVTAGRLFDVLNIPGLPQFGPALPWPGQKDKKLKMELQDNGTLLLTWESAPDKVKQAVVGISMIKHLELADSE